MPLIKSLCQSYEARTEMRDKNEDLSLNVDVRSCLVSLVVVVQWGGIGIDILVHVTQQS